MADNIKQSALDYHRLPRPGKISVEPIKPLANQRDLALAYSPGVAAACEAIVEDQAAIAEMTSRANLVGVISNGTAVLGLGNIGPYAAKPVMEGKAVLFKKFAGIDVFDIEIEQLDPYKFIEAVASLEPTFGGINLEDIKAPECFEIEEKLKERMNIPVFHDDQHGTAIIVSAAVKNGLRLIGKDMQDVKLVASGAGAAALACLELLVHMGIPRENIFVSDIDGVVYKGRTTNMDPRKSRFEQDTKARTLDDIIKDADIFLGLSAPRVLSQDAVKQMAANPIIMALANPDPEITPEEILEVRKDAIIATGRSDYPNQVNNVLCFPYIFRGALDVGATQINEEMKLACVDAIANLAMAESSDVVAMAYGGEDLTFGSNYIIPKPFDPRLVQIIPPAVARAAMKTGVATRPIEDFSAYNHDLTQYVYRSSFVMKPVFERARSNPLRIVYAEGEDENVLRAVQVVVDEKLAKPILVARPDVLGARIKKLGLRIKPGVDFEVCNPQNDPRYNEYWSLYHSLMGRAGVTPSFARTVVRTEPTVISALMVKRGEADAMICGHVGVYPSHYYHIHDILGLRKGVSHAAALHAIVLPQGIVFICDTNVCPEPTAEHLCEITFMASSVVRGFGLVPKVALISHSNFGSSRHPSAQKMREALRLINERQPDFEVDGEMHADVALKPEIRARIFPNSKLTGSANLLIMPNLDSANITLNTLKGLGEGLNIGPLLMGVNSSAHIITPSTSVRGIVNMSALAVVEAQEKLLETKSGVVYDLAAQ
jgi:malate dehydrogenase (oxaloacetate-decarboxylating)(NADP+)